MRRRASASSSPSVPTVPLVCCPSRRGRRASESARCFSLYDDQERLHGDALQETWITRHGEVFLAFGLRLVPPREGVTVTDALIHCTLGGLTEPARLDGSRLAGHGADGAALFGWPTGRGRRSDTLLWRSPRPPFYERWPPYFDQWSLAPDSFGWDRRRSGGDSRRSLATSCLPGCARRRSPHNRRWTCEGCSGAASARSSVSCSCWMRTNGRSRRVVERGSYRCYDELDGAFEVAAEEGGCELELPADAQERPVRIRVSGLTASRLCDRADGIRAPDLGRDTHGRSARRRSVGRRCAGGRSRLRSGRAARRSSPRGCPPGARRVAARVPATRRPAASDGPPSARSRPRRLHDRSCRRTAPRLAPAGVGASRAARSPAVLDAIPRQGLGPLGERARRGGGARQRSRTGFRSILQSTTPDGRVRSRYELEFPYVEGQVEVRLRAELTGAEAWDLPDVRVRRSVSGRPDRSPALGLLGRSPLSGSTRRVSTIRVTRIRSWSRRSISLAGCSTR